MGRVSFLPFVPRPGIKPNTQVCLLTGVEPMTSLCIGQHSNELSHTGQGNSADLVLSFLNLVLTS